MLEFGITNLVVLVVYLLGITVLGSMAARWIKNTDEFILPRKFGKSMLVMHAFGTGTHSDQAVTVAAKTYTAGLSGIWYQWLYLFITPFYWLIAPVMRRFRAITTADIFIARYGRSVSMLYAVWGMCMMVTNIGLMLKGSGAVISTSTGMAISTDMAIAGMTILFVIYGTAGGLGGAIITDFVQGIFTVLFSFILLPFVLSEVGGISGMKAQIANAKEMFSLVAPGKIGIFYVAVITINGLIGIVAQPHILGNCAAGRTEVDGQVGFMFGNFLKRVCTVAWTLTGLAAVAYFAGRTIKPDKIYGLMAQEFFPEIMPGMLGIFVASLLAAVMSSCDSFMIASSGLFTNNVYKRIFPEKKDHHYLWVARFTGMFMVLAGIAYAFWLPSVVRGLEIFWKVNAVLGIAFWMGLLWRRATPAGAWASAIVTLGMWWVSSQAWFVSWMAGLPVADHLQLVVTDGGTASMYMPWQMILYLSCGIIAGVGVSLLTRNVSREKLEHYYALLRTPVRKGEEVEAACELPKGAEVPPKDDLFPRSSLEIPKPSLNAVVGFVGGWVCVALIIIPVYLLVAA